MPSWETFGGYRSVDALLHDSHLTDDQKTNALKNWRATLMRMRPLQMAYADQIDDLLHKITTALEEIGAASGTASSRSDSEAET